MNTRDDLPPEATDRIMASVSARLIRYAASRMPAGLGERLGEEWIADLSQLDGALSRMRFALGCCWARQVIGREPHLYGARLSAAGHGHVDAINPPFPSLLPKRATVFLIIVSMHFAAAVAFIYAVKVHELPIPRPDMTLRFVPESRSATPPLPVPDTNLNEHRVVIPAPLVLGPIQYDSAEAIPAVAQPRTSLPLPGATPVRIAGGIGKGFPATLDFYPPSSIRLGEEGLTAVSVCVDDHGQLTTDPKVAVSSGSPRLDGGALALARAGSGHYRSATENGRAIGACFQIGVRFALRG